MNEAQSHAELEALRRSVNRGTPYGSDGWQVRMAKKLRLEFTLHSRGRPRKRRVERVEAAEKVRVPFCSCPFLLEFPAY